jgi:hypothetical protein
MSRFACAIWHIYDVLDKNIKRIQQMWRSCLANPLAAPIFLLTGRRFSLKYE